MSDLRHAWPIAAVSGAVAAAAVAGYVARDARDYSREQAARSKRAFCDAVDLLLNVLGEKRDVQPQPSRPQLRVIQGGAR